MESPIIRLLQWCAVIPHHVSHNLLDGSAEGALAV